jgi:D-proline reductase (dithiol) PrdB
VDPYRFLPFLSRKVMRSWAEREQPPQQVTWAPLRRPLSQCRIALISSAGIALRTDRPFDEDGERRNPWWGDPSWRALPADVTSADVGFHHLHVDAGPAEEDLDVVLPLRRLGDLVDEGAVGEVSPRHFSTMGYVLDATELTTTTAPELAAALAEDEVDLVLLVPV